MTRVFYIPYYEVTNRTERIVMKMILFTILTLMLVLLLVFSVVVIAATGAVGLVLFGDIIVCVVLIYFVIKKLILKK